MAEPDDREVERTTTETDGGDEEEKGGTPFDHPAFLPVLLWGLALWFGYDGWFNEDIEAVMFNRYGFAVLCVLGTWFTAQAVRDARRSRTDSESTKGS